ncbi:class IV adenylate cyclase [Algiphilus sp.]|uniref:class IV adenylate cyclase n=1 Tax=Algiphilus sp. TaxID=1872431 RepID=UPI0034547FDC
MARNMEIKARSRDLAAQRRIVSGLADAPPECLLQRDTFFHVPHGRLKLRELGDGTAELIQYERADTVGPKCSTYTRIAIADPDALRKALAVTLGVRVTVRKRRTVFIVDQTRVHLDEVEALGDFVELEVVLRTSQSEAEGTVIAEQLMASLGIAQTDLVSGAYADLLENAEFGDDATLARSR